MIRRACEVLGIGKIVTILFGITQTILQLHINKWNLKDFKIHPQQKSTIETNDMAPFSGKQTSGIFFFHILSF